MPNPGLSRQEALRRVETVEQCLREGHVPTGMTPQTGMRGAWAEAMFRLGKRINGKTSTVKQLEETAGREIDWSQYVAKGRREALEQRYTPPPIPDPEIPVEALIDRLAEGYTRRSEHRAAKKWMRFGLKEDGPYCIAVVGDPHLDDPGCNWPLLKRDVELMRTPNVHAVCLGDVTNNWSGKLVRLYADQETTRTQAWKLAEWFFGAVPWVVIIAGNHDMWSGSGDPLDWMARGHAVKQDWTAQFEVSTPSGHVVRIDARHDFKGSSIYNPLHGLMRARRFSDGEADILAAGHQHHAEIYQGQDPEKGSKPFWLVRARGYKHIDSYADNHQFESQDPRHGSTVGIVVDPDGGIQAYTDLSEAIEIMRFKRSKWEARNAKAAAKRVR